MHSVGSGNNALLLVLLVLVLVWSGVWKAIALWRAGRRADLILFVVLCLLNTVGILDIIYIFAISKRTPPTPPAAA